MPVTVLAFSLIAQLELAMSCRIKEEYGDRTSWLDLLEEKEKKQISRRLRTLQRENLVLPELDLADLGHKSKSSSVAFVRQRRFRKRPSKYRYS